MPRRKEAWNSTEKMNADLKDKSPIDVHQFFEHGPSMQLRFSPKIASSYYPEKAKAPG